MSTVSLAFKMEFSQSVSICVHRDGVDDMTQISHIVGQWGGPWYICGYNNLNYNLG